jgi:large subunit ribosomal protein L23
MKIDLVKNYIEFGKYAGLRRNNQYTFDVDLKLNKIEIKKIIEDLLNVQVLAVNTHIPPRKKKGKNKYTTYYKRAIITIKPLEPEVLTLLDLLEK